MVHPYWANANSATATVLIVGADSIVLQVLLQSPFLHLNSPADKFYFHFIQHRHFRHGRHWCGDAS